MSSIETINAQIAEYEKNSRVKKPKKDNKFQKFYG